MNLDLRFYWRLFLRRLPAMLAIVIICSVIGAVVAMRAPTVYRTEARLVVEDPQIPGDLASSTVRTNANSAIEIIRQRLLTRANMLDIANDLNVFENYSAMPPDDIVSQMRAATSISSRGTDPVIVTVSFRARNGQIAANVVNEYVTRIINANVELRTGSAEQTLVFFEQEAERLSTELDLQSARITQFQTENSGALPDEQQFRMSRLAVLQERIASAEREREALVDQRARIVEIFEATGEIAATGASPLTQDQQQLRQLERELENALLVFSEENSQVQLLQRRIAQQRIRMENNLANAVEDDAGATAGATALEVQLVQIDSQIETLDELLRGAHAQVETLEDAIARTPLNAITLRSLERDYENTRRQYDRVVASLAEASTGERIELTSRGQRISVIEAANVPRSPAGTNRLLIAAMGMATGLGVAAALFVLLELTNRSVRRPAELTSALGITPFATIPFIEDTSRQMMRRTMRIATFVIILVGVPAALWAVDTYYLPLDQLAQRILQRVGLT
jgi:polysaccharide chain length determinant protein (PEP-CTERM system associated)